MSTAPAPPGLSIDDYLEGELHSEVRHEFINGEVYAMVGASDRHNLIALNIASALRQQARTGSCQVFIADMKLRIDVGADEIFYYPDVLVTCDSDDRARYYRAKPCLVVEVLSETTERLDRREKLLAYTGIDSLRDYLLVSQDQPALYWYRRCKDWRVELPASDAVLQFDCGGLNLPFSAIYEGVDHA